MNVALESLELGWLVFGKATALQSRERNIFQRNTKSCWNLIQTPLVIISTFLVTAYYRHNMIYDNEKCFSKHVILTSLFLHLNKN